MAIVKRSGGYGVRVWRGGRHVWIGTRARLKAARELERTELARADVATSEETIASFAARWPRDYPRARASTNRRNTYAVRALVRAHGQLRLHQLTRPQARAFAMANPSAWETARVMFADAAHDGLIPANPFDRLRLPRSRGRRDDDPPTELDAHRLAKAAERAHGPRYGPHFSAMILFSFYVGLRAGELFGLDTDDVDFARGEVLIQRSVDAQGRPGLTKSGKARTVALPPPAAAAALQARDNPPASWHPRLFLSKRGKPLRTPSHWYLWNLVRQEAGHPGLDWHLLRHGCATYLMDIRGLDHNAVAYQLGHANAGLVLERYGHPSEELARQRIRDSFASGAGGTTPLF